MTLLEKAPAESFREGTVPVLETERLTLRAPRMDDVEAVAILANDLRIAQNTTSLPHPYTLADAQSWLAAANNAEDEAIFLATLASGAIIGTCGIKRRRPAAPEGGYHIGYWLGAPYWGKGYATEAARAVIDHAFGDLGHEILYSSARISNPASRRVLEKCGFQWTGVGLYRIRSLASSAPADRFRLDRGIWASLKSWGAARRIV